MTTANEEWNPSKPLENKEDEDEAQRRAKAKARVDFLVEENRKKVLPAKKKGLFD